MQFKNLFAGLKLNIKSGITVSLISIPLSVSLAVASQTSPIAGIITAIWAGLIASILGGSNFNIVGPTGALSGILATYAITNGADALPTLAIMSGVIILVAYLFKLERFLVFVPGSTVQGFTVGVAFIIGLNQLNSALGLKVPEIHERFIENLVESVKHFNTLSLPTLGLFILFFVGLLLLAKYLPKIPGAILLTPIGILIGYLTTTGKLPFTLTTLGMKFSDMSAAIFLPFSFKFTDSLFITAITIAVIAILETMISAKIADGMTKTKHNKRKEMLGLAVANIVTGFFGGIPATAALARTSLNIKSGATDKLSATISSISIVAISFILLGAFKYIPMAVIAAILVFVAVRMVEVDHLKHMFNNDKSSFALALLVAFVTVYEDPIVGILFGTAISLIIFMSNLSKGQFELMTNDLKTKKHTRISKEEAIKLDKESHTLVYTIKGQMAYINTQAHISRFENRLNGTQNIVLRLRELYFIDQDGVDAIDEIIEICHAAKRNVMITGVSDYIEEQLERSDDFRRLKENGKVFDKTSQALEALGFKAA